MPHSVSSWLSGVALAMLLGSAPVQADEVGIDLVVCRST
jgi:hypothetical protein